MDKISALEKEALLHNNTVDEIIASGGSSVEQFYSGKNVFVTGGTGFLGKSLIEKLFRCCNVNKIFLLTRTKKDKSGKERIVNMLSDPVFDYLHKHKPAFADNVLPIEGDVGEIQLGMSTNDRTMIIDQVNIIFHSAASVSFNQSIKVATLINVRGTREVLRLAKACKNLRSIVHVSTAYSNATKNRINLPVKEQFYDCPISPNAMIEMVERIEENKLNDVIEIIRDGWPNIYTFTKSLAEEVIRYEGQDLPISIIRPSIVISSYREPLPGWIDSASVFGASGIILGLMTGVIHVLRRHEGVFSVVPVDIVNNVTIVAALETSRRQSNEDSGVIYNVTNYRNPMMFNLLSQILNTDGRNMVASGAVWYCFALETSYRFLYVLYFWLLHYIPGFFADLALRLMKKRPMALNVYKKVLKLSTVLDYFTNNDWKFYDDNTLNLYNNLSKNDRLIFNCDIATISAKEMVLIWIYGIHKYIIKDNNRDTEKINRKQFRLKIVTYVIFCLFFYILYIVLRSIYGVIFKYV